MDEPEFQRLTEPHRAALRLHCYRLLGSVHDAEDALQETLLRAWRGRAGAAGPATYRAWLYKIATHVCLDELGRRPRRGLPMGHGPPADPAQGIAAAEANRSGWSRARMPGSPAPPPAPRRAARSARAWRWHSWWRYRCCRRSSGPCCSCGTCSAGRPATQPSCWN